MARKRRGPWQRKQDGCWYTTIGRTSHRLGTADDAWEVIEAEYHKLHAKGEKPSVATAAWLSDQFLEFAELHRSPATYEWYKYYLSEFVARVGQRLKARDVSPSMVGNWIESRFGDQSASVKHHAARCVVRVMNWAVKERLLDRSPLAGYVKPAPSSRETAITKAQYKTCLANAKGPVRDMLEMLWHSGCRPQELH